jgi:hypothetical protein
MKKALLAVAALTCMGSAALAGPNAGGTLIAALSVGTVYCTDTGNYCGSSTTTDCNGAVTSHTGGTPAVINVIAAFPGPARLAGLTFGIAYSAGVVLIEWGACGDFELPDGAWPASGTGTAVTWSSAQTAQLIEAYWIAAYNYYGGCETLALGPHPTQGGNFADDDVPSNIDPIDGYGLFGFNCPGSGPCPSGEQPGACCHADGSCEDLFAADCQQSGDTFLGEGTSCLVNGGDCPQPATGACCIGTDCIILTEDECTAAGGSYQGDDVPCPADCGGTPVIESTWGVIKNSYR